MRAKTFSSNETFTFTLDLIQASCFPKRTVIFVSDTFGELDRYARGLLTTAVISQVHFDSPGDQFCVL